tara:strand:- start:10600 stop:11370 length:771 start_codon:yes stop_codon:yes gene_type:complete
MAESKKRDAINKIFDSCFKKNPNSNVLKFNNDQVKEVTGTEFSNQFDATKFDSSEKLPSRLEEEGYFIVHLGKGNHAFVKGDGFHKLEEIEDNVNWKLSKSSMDDISDSEAQSASTAFNDKIIHDFLFDDKSKKILLHTARRSKLSYDMVINGEKLQTNKLQIELDGVYETEDTIATMEVKNLDNGEFEIRQLFSSMKYFEQLKEDDKIDNKVIRLLFMVRERKRGNYYKLYEYEFINKDNPNSIKLIKCKRYNIT